MKFWLIALLLMPSAIDAQELNTGVLPGLWYSQTEVREGDSIMIYGGIQNHSGQRVTGTAIFYIDGAEISRNGFVSEDDTLIKLSAPWQATSGEHEAELRISELTPATEDIWSQTSGKVKLKVERVITAEEVKEVLQETAQTVIEKIDAAANGLADRVAEYKESSTGTESGSVAGTSTMGSIAAEHSLSFLEKVLRHWPWSMGIFVLIFLYFAFRP